MLIKEYRIPLPLTVDEYRIAQLYMIQRKSRQESSGSDSRVEILVNKPYKDGPGGDGQYTHKVYHVGSHLPSWIRGILPKTALKVEEEAWNAYPYCRTKFTCPFMEKFVIDVETIYEPDNGGQSNAFKLQGAEARREIDFINIVKDPCSDDRDEEDPKLYRSAETGRGPLADNWLETIESDSVMCAYKVCRVEFRYWGMQTRVERFIHEVALRKTMLTAHRQAWAWQDEWCHLNMDDIRRLEKETELALRTVGGERPPDDDDDDDDRRPETIVVASLMAKTKPTPLAGSGSQHMLPSVAKIEDNAHTSPNTVAGHHTTASSSSSPSTTKTTGKSSASDAPLASLLSTTSVATQGSPSQSLRSRVNSTERFGRNSLKKHRSVKVNDFEAERMVETAFSGMVGSDSESEDEFYDAVESVDVCNALEGNLDAQESVSFDGYDGPGRLTISTSNQLIHGHGRPVALLGKDDSFDDVESVSSDDCDQMGETLSPIEVVEQATISPTQPSNPRRIGHSRSELPPPTVVTFPPSPVTAIKGGSAVADDVCQRVSVNTPSVQHLLLVFHGGQPLDVDHDLHTQQFNVNLFKSGIDSVAETHYSQVAGRVAVVHVPCPAFSAPALEAVGMLNTGSHLKAGQGDRGAITGTGLLSMTPLLAVSRHDYQEYVTAAIEAANAAYTEFVQSQPSHSFRGDISIVADCMGAVLAYDAMIRSATSSRHQCRPTSLHAQLSRTPSPVNDSPCPGATELRGNSDTQSSSMVSAAPPTFLFQVTHFFALGSPLGLILAQRSLSHSFPGQAGGSTFPPFSGSGNFYNVLYEASFFSARIEPLLNPAFSSIPLQSIAQYRQFPYGDGVSHSISSYVVNNPSPLGSSGHPSSPSLPLLSSRDEHRTGGVAVGIARRPLLQQPSRSVDSLESNVTDAGRGPSMWWGEKRVDYCLYAPESVDLLPDSAIPPFLHGSFWESHDVAAFITRQLISPASGAANSSGREATPFVPLTPREKWLKKRTHLTVKGMSSNHRGIDCFVNPRKSAVIAGKFTYGSLDISTLSQEKIDLYIMQHPPCGNWVLMDTQLTDRQGRVYFNISPELSLPPDLYPVKMVVRGDHTQGDAYLAVVPPNTEVVVFSVDGSFAASLSLFGTDPRVHAGAVDVVRYWQELNFLIVYVTARPSIQKHRVTSWLAQHNFPHGIIFFSEGLTADPQSQKLAALHALKVEAHVAIHRAYGSSKDKKTYKELGLSPNQIFVVGKPSRTLRGSKKLSAQYITDGYAMHLDDLHLQTHTTPANANFQLRKQTFGLPPTRKHRSKATSGTDISLGSTQHSSPVAQREGSIGYRTFSKKLPMFRSRRTSTKTPHDQQTDLHHCLSATSLSSFRDRSNSDPSVAAASAAAKAIEKKRKLTPPASYSSDYAPVQNTCASPHSNLLSAPADVNRSLSVPAMNSPEEPDARQSHRMKRRSMDVRHLPARSTDV